MRVGITVNFQHSFFSSGLSQAVLSLGEIYRIQGYEVVFINTEDEKLWWDDLLSMKDSWTSIHVSALESAAVDCVIEIGSLLLTIQQRSFVKKSVWFSRKAPLFHDIEASLFPFERSDRNLEGVSEIWLYEEMCTSDDCQYIELLTRKPVRLLPYIWTPSAIELYRQETKAPVWPQVSHMTDKWSIHICETNNTSASSCAIPLLTMREVRRAGRCSLNPVVKIHNAENIKTTEFFRGNILAHAFSDITDMSGQFMGRQRIVDWVYDPKSVIIAHSRFTSMRPYHLDALWVGIPLVHNSKVLCRLGLLKGFYNDNEISQAAAAFERVVGEPGTVEELIELRKKILDTFSPLSARSQKLWKEAMDFIPSAPAKSNEASKSNGTYELASPNELRVGFTCMWDSFQPDYNMFTLMLAEAGKALDRDVVGVSIDSMPEGAEDVDVLIFGPFGDRWQKVNRKIPKIHYTGENTEPIRRDDIKLNLGFRHVDMNDSSYLRLPLWMLEINWFRADANRIVNPKPLPIDRCCKVYLDEVHDKFCAFVVTNPRQPIRNSAFHWLSQYKKVDSAGRLFNNIGDKIFAGLGGGGGEIRKLEFLKSYKFCLTYENESAPGYTTEKWLHAKAAGAIPIYWGDPKFEREFDIDGCVDARQAVTPQQLIELVSKVDNDKALYDKMRSKPALDDVRRDLVRRTLSECARRIWKLADVAGVEKIPRFLGYTSDSDCESPPQAEVSTKGLASMDTTVFVTGCNERFLPSLHIQLTNLEEHRKSVSELTAIVYLMDDISTGAEVTFKNSFPFAEFRRFPKASTFTNFPDIWDPQHFAWKIWILNEICGDSRLAGRLVLYMDTGVMMCRWPRSWLSVVREKGVCVLEDPRQKNKNWCHDVFIRQLNVTAAELDKQQIWAGALAIMAGHEAATRLLKDSWKWAQIREVISGAKWSGIRDGTHYGHRHDQSILSVLSARMGLPRLPLDEVYCDVSLRQTFLSKRSLYCHRGLFQVHAPVATGIDDAYVINLDRRADRMEKFKTTHPDLDRAHRFSAFEGSKLQLTDKIARLFQPHDFNWKKPVMGCALSHLSLWTQLLSEPDDINTYLIMEDDAKLSPVWREAWEKIHRHDALPADWDVVYLGGILPPNKEVFTKSLIEPVNDYVARIRKNTFFGQREPSRYMHFCAYAYVLSKRGAQKIIDVLKAKGGYWTSADHMICNLHEFMNIYFTNPLIAGCFQDEDPVYCASQFNDFSRVDTFDSDLWNNNEHFSKKEVGVITGELDIMGALEDARKSMVCEAVVPKAPRGKRFISFEPCDMSKFYEFAWFKQIFSSMSLDIECVGFDETPADDGIVILMRPTPPQIRRLEAWAAAGVKFYILHMSDEYSQDPIGFYPLAQGVIRNYYRKEVAEGDKIITIPLGFHWAIPDGEPVIHTPRPPFREFVWSFVGTGWAGRKEKLRPLEAVPGDHKLVFMDQWNSPSMIGREESLSILLNSWFVPCPAGNNGETFRIYEALEAGSIPIVVQEPGMEDYFAFIGRYLPLMLATSWEHAAQLIYTLRKEPEIYEKYRLQLLEAWENCKLHTKRSVLKVLGL
jgi:GR25 family glycosyltransferase involved in LPS biosynthesis